MKMVQLTHTKVGEDRLITFFCLRLYSMFKTQYWFLKRHSIAWFLMQVYSKPYLTNQSWRGVQLILSRHLMSLKTELCTEIKPPLFIWESKTPLGCWSWTCVRSDQTSQPGIRVFGVWEIYLVTDIKTWCSLKYIDLHIKWYSVLILIYIFFPI